MRATLLSSISAFLALLIGLVAGPVMAQNAEVFRVWVEDKTNENPFYQRGWDEAFVVDAVGAENGIQGRDLVLERGVTYTFQMVNVPVMHPFYISTSESGFGAGVYNEGVTGNFVSGNGTLTFTPGEDAPNLLYYQCGAHDFMGGRIYVIGEVSVDLEPVAEGLTAPVYLTEAPDGSGRLFVVDQAGHIRIITADGALLEEPFLDLSGRMVQLRDGFDERGALGIAFHPGYAQNGRFFVHYSGPLRDGAPEGWDHTTHISEFRVSQTDPDRADPDSERLILQVDQPQFNHNGGSVAFGPDGYLYISLGDGGGGGDTGLGHVEDWYEANQGGNAQAFDQNLLGTILRIDVEADPYAVPPDNPFVGTDGLDEIWAFGLRNPYRIAFDSEGDHELFAGDAGQIMWEAVYLVERGGNYGWNVREGSHCFNTEDRLEVRPACPDTDPDGRPLVPPVIEYAHFRQVDGLGVVVIGGQVYRGGAIPELQGRYVFGDWSGSPGEPAGRVFVVTERLEGAPWHFSELRFANRPGEAFGHFLLGIGRDLAGEVYLLGSDRNRPEGNTGVVYRLAPAGTVSAEGDPQQPLALFLEQNHPNPFSGSTTIRFHLAEPGPVTLTVYDVLGRVVATIVQDELPAGAHAVTWDLSGLPSVASGVYLYRLSNGQDGSTRVMTVLR
jgi:glucose/arabinose dehydrogenase